MWNHVPFANFCQSSNWWDLFTRQTILSRYKAQSRHINPAAAQTGPILLIGLFVYKKIAALKASCLKILEFIFFLYIYADSGWHLAAGHSYQCPWWQPPFPPALSKLLEQIQQAFQLPPPVAEGYLSPDSHKAHHTNISPPAMPLSFCSAVTSVMVLFLWENEALPPLICLHLSSNLSAAHIPSQNMTALHVRGNSVVFLSRLRN